MGTVTPGVRTYHTLTDTADASPRCLSRSTRHLRSTQWARQTSHPSPAESAMRPRRRVYLSDQCTAKLYNNNNNNYIIMKQGVNQRSYSYSFTVAQTVE